MGLRRVGCLRHPTAVGSIAGSQNAAVLMHSFGMFSASQIASPALCPKQDAASKSGVAPETEELPNTPAPQLSPTFRIGSDAAEPDKRKQEITDFRC
jgi:hypothetical protein